MKNNIDRVAEVLATAIIRKKLVGENIVNTNDSVGQNVKTYLKQEEVQQTQIKSCGRKMRRKI